MSDMSSEDEASSTAFSGSKRKREEEHSVASDSDSAEDCNDQHDSSSEDDDDDSSSSDEDSSLDGEASSDEEETEAVVVQQPAEAKQSEQSPSSSKTPPSSPGNSSNRKEVEKVSMETGEVVQIYHSVNAAAESVACAPCNISKCLIGNSKSCKGFFWRYKGSTRLPVEIKSPSASRSRGVPVNSRPVERLDLKMGIVLSSYPSIREAAEAVGGKPQDIKSVLEGSSRSGCGFFWRYEGEDDKFPEGAELGTATWGSGFSYVPSIHHAAKATAMPAVRTVSKPAKQEKPTTGIKKSAVPEDGGIVPHGNPSKLRRPVEKLDFETGEVIARYESISEAARQIGTSQVSVSVCLAGKTKSCRGYFWRYLGSDRLPEKRKTRTGSRDESQSSPSKKTHHHSEDEGLAEKDHSSDLSQSGSENAAEAIGVKDSNSSSPSHVAVVSSGSADTR